MDERDPTGARDIARSTVRAAIDNVEHLGRVLRTGGAPNYIRKWNADARADLVILSKEIDNWKVIMRSYTQIKHPATPVNQVPAYPDGAHEDFVAESERIAWVRQLTDAQFQAVKFTVEQAKK